MTLIVQRLMLWKDNTTENDEGIAYAWMNETESNLPKLEI